MNRTDRRGWRGRWAGMAAGAAGLALALAAAGQVGALPLAATSEKQVSPLHPTFALLDAAGFNVLDSGGPASARETCGQCHDTAYIEEHNLHAGRAEPGAASAWTGASGLAGEWDPLNYTYDADGTPLGISDPAAKSGKYVTQIEIVDGTLTATFGNQANANIEDGLLSLKPFVSGNNDVIWVCGQREIPSGAQEASTGDSGEDQTDLLAKYLPANCRSST